ncbi:MAG: ATP-binding protein [Pseudomonadota bacterium]
MAALEEQGRAASALHREIVRGWLGRYRALAPIYAHNPEVVRLLRWPGDGLQVDLVNQRLEEWNSASGASDTYVLDANGDTLAASNWNEQYSFVGQNFSYRPYFTDAMQGRLGRYFALGTTSGKRGYYFAFPVRDARRTIGAVVVKVPVDAIEQELRASPVGVFISDSAGVIVLSGHPDWRLRTIDPLTETEVGQIRAHRQFDPGALVPVAISGLDGAGPTRLVRAMPDRSEAAIEEFLHLSQPMTVEGWTLHLMLPTAAMRRQILTIVLLAGSVMLLIAAGGVIVLQRRRRLVERLAERERARDALERAVTARTADLRRTQAELVQAGKLAALGQMSAALSHEFNQPLAAVRSYAENAVAFLDRGHRAQAGENLARISRLTQRMAQLSKHLTSFSRKPRDTLGPVRLDAALDETLALLAGRIERASVDIVRRGEAGLTITGGQTRLQHVLMNIIGNGIDACAGSEAARITIETGREGDEVTVRISDTGPGLPHEVASQVFDPFFTTKPEGKGLGLGLSISYNIVRDFGGTLSAGNAETGALFTVTLQSADAPVEPAE